jgi:SAM-dependent MidA family methyltransferase
LHERILAKIAGQNGISFPEYLGIALYDPELGYYARSANQVGRGGDFYTSVSVGPLFGRLLARRLLRWWDENGQPRVWRTMEIGAHDGKLAADILTEIRQLNHKAWEGLEYAIPEPLPRLRQLQKERLANLASKLRITADLVELAESAAPGIAFGNEILDALPFHLVEMQAGNWRELYVTGHGEGQLQFEPGIIAIGSDLEKRATSIGRNFPEGYRTEIRTNFGAFLHDIAKCISSGLLLFTDYGFAAPEYYDNSRGTGTLRTFSKHKAGEDPLALPGECDITAHVDFTDLAKRAAENGYSPILFSNQGSYLTGLAREMILGGKISDAKTIAQFRSLTHPAHLGASFHAIEFTRGAEIPAEVSHRLAL